MWPLRIRACLSLVLLVTTASFDVLAQSDPEATRSYVNCLCRCSSGWAAHIGVWYDPEHNTVAECKSVGPCIGGIGAYGCSSRHFLNASFECSNACWDSAYGKGTFNPATASKFSDDLNQKYRQRTGSLATDQ